MKKLFMALMVCAVFATSAFAQSGFEFGLTFPMGVGIGTANYAFKDGVTDAQKKYYEYETGAGFEWGATLQAGYMFDLGNDMGVSILLEAGYHRDVLAYSGTRQVGGGNNSPSIYKDTDMSFVFDTIQIGVLPKFNLTALNIAIGLGGGIKIPVSFIMYTQYLDRDGELLTMGQGSMEYFKDSFEPTVIPYVKLTFDYFLPIDEKTSLAFGAYVGYDFNISAKLDDEDRINNRNIYSNLSFGSVDVGAQLGIKYSL